MLPNTSMLVSWCRPRRNKFYSSWNRPSNADRRKDWNFVGKHGDDTLEKVSRIRDKFEYDRDKRMREKAFASMCVESASNLYESNPKNQPLDVERYFS